MHSRTCGCAWWSWKELSLHGCLQRVRRWDHREAVVRTDVYCRGQAWGEHGCIVAKYEGLLLRSCRRNLQTAELACVRVRRGRHSEVLRQ